jgi:HPt (histidine-containing phosphotransfer) domain-containing protein
MIEATQLAEKRRQLGKLGGPAFVQKMTALFIEHAPPRLAAIVQGVQQGDLAAVEFAAHSLKSSAANLGAVRVQELAERIEVLAASRQGDQLQALVTELTTSLDGTIAWLKQQPPEAES